MSTFAEYFTPILAQEAEQYLKTADEFILFIGRPTCPYCRRFEPKLTQVAKDNDLTVYYLNSENQDSVTQDLRLTYNIPTVPALVVAKSGKVRVVCDSSLSEAVILDFINQD